MAQHQQIDIQIMRTHDPLGLSIQKKLDEVPYQSTTTKREITIFRVPSHIRERNKNFYEPRMVSIGPYHRRREDLKCMEKEKLRYLRKMISKNANVTLDDYLKELRKLESAARKCYYENIEMDSDEFVEMLLYDACFIIQLVVNWSSQDSDIVNDISWNIPLIRSDLLMLENQIPFFVLQAVFDLYSDSKDHTSNMISLSHLYLESKDHTSNIISLYNDGESKKTSLIDLLFVFLDHWMETFFPAPEGDNPYDHLLDFYYQCFMHKQGLPMKSRRKLPFNFLLKLPLPLMRFLQLPTILPAMIRSIMYKRRHRIIRKRIPRMIPCATELQDAGITLKKADAHTIFSVDFTHGVLRIPSLSVAEETTPQIMNLRAYEQCSGQKRRPFTCYTMFLDCIVKMPRDVQILQQNRILENMLGNEKAAAVFFNQLRYFSYLDNEWHHLAELFKNVNDYCNYSRWQKYKAKLLRDYFSNPWSIISLTAAVVLLLLTFTQTMYTVMPYYRPSH